MKIKVTYTRNRSKVSYVDTYPKDARLERSEEKVTIYYHGTYMNYNLSKFDAVDLLDK